MGKKERKKKKEEERKKERKCPLLNTELYIKKQQIMK